MRHCLFLAAGVAAVVATAAPAMAQDEANPWSGWYLGGNAGANWGGSQSRTTVTSGGGAVVIPPADAVVINGAPLSRSTKTGFTGGIEGGYGYKAGDIVLGVETDFGAFNIDQNGAATYTSLQLTNPPVNYALSHTLSTDWLWTLRPRAGYILGRWFLYGTGGLALSHVKLRASYADTTTQPNVINLSTSSTRVGWTAGGGVAFAITPRWSIKAEYLYTDLGTISGLAGTSSGFATLGARSSIRSNLVRVGLDFRF
jgi:outer membrane immunogenic protein